MESFIMEMQVANESQVCEALNELREQGKFRQAFDLGQHHWGDYQSWRNPAQLQQLIPVLGRLGQPRQADYLRIKLWRRFPEQSKHALGAVYDLMAIKGPAFIWELADRFLKDSSLDNNERAEWLFIKALISSTAKDHTQAEKFYQKGLDFESGTEWAARVHALMLSDQEDFKGSTSLLRAQYERKPTDTCLRHLASSMSNSGSSRAEIIDLFKSEIVQFESIPCLLQLGHLYADEEMWSHLPEIVSQVNQLKIGSNIGLDESIHYFNGYTHYGAGELAEASESFKKCKQFFSKTVGENLQQAKNDNKKILPVTFIKQNDMTCAPASMASILQFHGLPYTQSEIADAICYDGTRDLHQRNWLKDKEIVYREFDLTWEAAKSMIDNQLPFAMITRSGSGSHMQVVHGYHEALGVLYLMDPSNASTTQMLGKEAIEHNASVGPRCLLPLPHNTKTKVEAISFKNEKLYTLYHHFDTALDKHDRKLAVELLKKLNSMGAKERLSLLAERQLAAYDQDDSRLKSALEKLLEIYPDEIWMIRNYFSLLFRQGKRKEGIQFLYKKVEEYGFLDLVETLFLEIYEDVSETETAKRLVKRLRKSARISAESCWLLGHYYWNLSKRKLAARYYRWAFTLNDKVETYGEAFFKAYRILGRQDEALQFLKKRWKLYGELSYGPAISLFNALELMDMEHKGLEVLRKSCTMASAEDYLIAFYLKTTLRYNLIDEFKQAYKQLASKLSPRNRAALKARLFEAQHQQEKAAAAYEKLLKHYPASREYRESRFKLLNNLGETSVIEQELIELENRFGRTFDICWMIIDWTENKEKRIDILKHYVKNHSDDFGAVCQLARAYINNEDFTEANRVIDNALKMSQSQIPLLAIKSELLLRNNEVEHARELAWQAMNLNVDSGTAFDCWLDSFFSEKEKLSALNDVKELMFSAITHGDVLWNYWHAAQNHVPREELTETVTRFHEKYPKLWYSWVIPAKQFMASGQLEKAKYFIQQSVERFPLIPRVYLEKAEIELVMLDRTAAIDSLNECLRLSPSWSYVARKLALELENAGRLKEALDVLEKTGRFNRWDGVLFGLQADLLYKLGDKKSAIERLKLAIENEIEYPWAWDRLKEWGDDDSLDVTFAKKLTEKYPKSVFAWRARAHVEPEVGHKVECFEKALSIQPDNIRTHEQLIDLYLNVGEYDNAEKQIHSEVWRGEPPRKIQLRKAKLFRYQGRNGEAIQYLEDILSWYPNFVDALTLAHDWYRHFELHEKAVNSARRLVDLQPHDSYTLSRCADTLLELESEALYEEAANWVERAFIINPQDKYTVLTWMDILLAKKDYESFAKADKQVSVSFPNDPLILVRRIQSNISQDKFDSIIDIWKIILEGNVNNPWIYEEVFNRVKKKEITKQLDEYLEHHIVGVACCDAMYRVWTRRKLAQKNGYLQVVASLENRFEGNAWHSVCYYLLEFFIRKNPVTIKSFIKKHFDKIIADYDLAGVLGYLYLSIGQYSEADNVYRRLQYGAETPAYIYYHYHLIRQEFNDWKKSSELVSKALSVAPDHVYGNLLLWHVFYSALAGERCNQDLLVNVDRNDLNNLEKYAFDLLIALIYSYETFPHDLSEELSKALRNAQMSFTPVNDDNVAKIMKKEVRSILKKETNQLGLLQKLKVRFWLSNRF